MGAIRTTRHKPTYGALDDAHHARAERHARHARAQSTRSAQALLTCPRADVAIHGASRRDERGAGPNAFRLLCVPAAGATSCCRFLPAAQVKASLPPANAAALRCCVTQHSPAHAHRALVKAVESLFQQRKPQRRSCQQATNGAACSQRTPGSRGVSTNVSFVAGRRCAASSSGGRRRCDCDDFGLVHRHRLCAAAAQRQREGCVLEEERPHVVAEPVCVQVALDRRHARVSRSELSRNPSADGARLAWLLAAAPLCLRRTARCLRTRRSWLCQTAHIPWERGLLGASSPRRVCAERLTWASTCIATDGLINPSVTCRTARVSATPCRRGRSTRHLVQRIGQRAADGRAAVQLHRHGERRD